MAAPAEAAAGSPEAEEAADSPAAPVEAAWRLAVHRHRDHRLLRDPSGAAQGAPARRRLRAAVARAAPRRPGRGCRGRRGRRRVRRRPRSPRRARELYLEIQDAWTRDDRARLRELVLPDLMAEWDRRLDDFASRGQRNVVDVEVLEVQQVGLVNRADDDEDRVVVLMQATQLDYVAVRGAAPRAHRRRRAATSAAIVHGVLDPRASATAPGACSPSSGPQEGVHHLTAAARRRAGERRARPRRGGLRDRRGRRGRRTPASPDLLSVGYEGDAEPQAQDAALVDGRFAADVLETAVRRAVEAWLDAMTAPTTTLLAVGADRRAAVRRRREPHEPRRRPRRPCPRRSHHALRRPHAARGAGGASST